jgi:hypothetical protein
MPKQPRPANSCGSSTTPKMSNNKTVKKKPKVTLSPNFIKSIAKLQRGLFLTPKSSNKKNKK